MLLHTLRGQYEAITCEPNLVFSKQQHFREVWTKLEVLSHVAFSAPPLWKDPKFRCVNAFPCEPNLVFSKQQHFREAWTKLENLSHVAFSAPHYGRIPNIDV